MNPSDKQAVLQSLNRLSDNHTRKKAWDELTARADRLDGHTIGPFLLCLHNTTAQHTLPCRCGAVRMYAHLAGIQPTLLPPHLPRIADVLADHDIAMPARVRTAERGLVRTDGGNLIYDAKCAAIHDPVRLADDLKLITGVVEHGLFLDLADEAIIGGDNGVDILLP